MAIFKIDEELVVGACVIDGIAACANVSTILCIVVAVCFRHLVTSSFHRRRDYLAVFLISCIVLPTKSWSVRR